MTQLPIGRDVGTGFAFLQQQARMTKAVFLTIIIIHSQLIAFMATADLIVVEFPPLCASLFSVYCQLSL